MSRRVVKLGGSLLNRTDWPDQLSNWLAVEPAVETILIVGGGRFVDELRRYDQALQLGDSVSHKLAVDLMSVTAELVARVLDWPLRSRVGDSDGNCVLDVKHFCEQSELPHSWAVTSDSIAAAVAIELGVELVLLKFTVDKPIEELVDDHFHRLVSQLKQWRVDTPVPRP